MRRLVIATSTVAAALAVAAVVYVWFPVVGPESVPLDRFSGGAGSGYYNALLLQNPPTWAHPSVRFSGATADGYAQAAHFTNVQVPIPPSPRFSGNVADGYTCGGMFTLNSARMPPSPRYSGGMCDGYITAFPYGSVGFGSPRVSRFAGGASDGYDTIVLRGIAGPYQNAIRFAGGSSDGYVYALLLTSTNLGAAATRRFAGGSYDGSATGIFLSSGNLWGLLSPRYFGGSFDGHDARLVRVPIGTIAVDTDLDGLPDWWEERWYTNIVSISASDDTDNDGAGAFAEYVAGTHPRDPESVFAIGTIKVEGDSVVLVYSTLDSRLYSLQSVGALGTGTWSNVAGFTAVPGSLFGMTTNTVNRAATNGMYRVTVRFP